MGKSRIVEYIIKFFALISLGLVNSQANAAVIRLSGQGDFAGYLNGELLYGNIAGRYDFAFDFDKSSLNLVEQPNTTLYFLSAPALSGYIRILGEMDLVRLTPGEIGYNTLKGRYEQYGKANGTDLNIFEYNLRYDGISENYASISIYGRGFEIFTEKNSSLSQLFDLSSNGNPYVFCDPSNGCEPSLYLIRKLEQSL